MSLSAFEEIEARANDTRWVKETFLIPSCEVRSVDWIYDLPGKVKEAPVDASPVSIALTQAILAARGEIVIQSPYFVLSENAQEVFSKIREELPQVRVIVSTNSLAATDNWATYAAHYKEKRVYLDDLGLEMWEFKPVPKGISGMMNYGKLLARLPLPGETQRYGEKKFRIQDFDDPPSGDLRLRTKAGSGLMNPHLKVPPTYPCMPNHWSWTATFPTSDLITSIPVRIPTTPRLAYSSSMRPFPLD